MGALSADLGSIYNINNNIGMVINRALLGRRTFCFSL